MTLTANHEQIQDLAALLAPEISGEIRLMEPMSAHTTLGLGGPADLFVRVGNLSDLKTVLHFCGTHRLDVYPIGDGSNLLVSDLGVRGAVVKLDGEFNTLQESEEGMLAGAGVGVSAAITCAANAGLAGLENLYGVPGSIGGAVFMNAGTRFGCMADILQEAHIVSAEGEGKWVPADDLGLSYRTSALQSWNPPAFITHARFHLQSEEVSAVKERIARMSDYRRQSQPLNWRSCGCIFRNPDGDQAGRLIDAAGLKGESVGDVRVSDQHANFFIHDGQASAQDVYTLARLVQREVKNRYGVDLEMEVRLLGEWPDE